MNEPKIKYIDHSLAFHSKGVIYINKDLLKDNYVFDKVMNHELKHFNGEKNVDINEPLDFCIIMFCIRNPSTWTNCLPIIKEKNIIFYDKTKLLIWIFIIIWFLIFISVLP